ncbi:MAG TPA: RNA-binding protein [Ruminococcaceae bacterium]|mgnify:CR=1 FL=1|nr:RNA-binding protein [Oscillospiraceae bacterium]
MKIQTGCVVLALAGHDKGGCFAVIDCADDSHALIADGRRRKVEKPKCKQFKHLQAVGVLETPETGTWTNRLLRKALAEFGTGLNATAASREGI